MVIDMSLQMDEASAKSSNSCTRMLENAVVVPMFRFSTLDPSVWGANLAIRVGKEVRLSDGQLRGLSFGGGALHQFRYVLIHTATWFLHMLAIWFHWNWPLPLSRCWLGSGPGTLRSGGVWCFCVSVILCHSLRFVQDFFQDFVHVEIADPSSYFVDLFHRRRPKIWLTFGQFCERLVLEPVFVSECREMATRLLRGKGRCSERGLWLNPVDIYGSFSAQREAYIRCQHPQEVIFKFHTPQTTTVCFRMFEAILRVYFVHLLIPWSAWWGFPLMKWTVEDDWRSASVIQIIEFAEETCLRHLGQSLGLPKVCQFLSISVNIYIKMHQDAVICWDFCEPQLMSPRSSPKSWWTSERHQCGGTSERKQFGSDMKWPKRETMGKQCELYNLY